MKDKIKQEMIKLWYENLCEDPIDGTTKDIEFMKALDALFEIYD